METNWRTSAECRDEDTDLFIHHHSKATTRSCFICDQALKVCQRCPVRRECLREAMDFGHFSQVGIWGGTTKKQRQRMRTQ